MPNYFISNGSQIINFIIAGSKEIAEQVTGLDVIEADSAPEGMNIGWILVNGVWTSPEIP